MSVKTAYDVRAATAAAVLAEQLRQCLLAHADDKPLPDPEAVDFDDPDAVEYAFRTVAALCGLDPDETRNLARMMRLFQALAEMISEQGSNLEIILHNIISVTTEKELVRIHTERAE